MNPKAFKQLKRVNNALRTNSYRVYKHIVTSLCQTYQAFEYTSKIKELLELDDINGLVHLADSLSKQSYVDATHHFVANQFALLIKKYPFPPGLNTFDPEGSATRKFLATEHKCHRVNQRFRCYSKRSPYEPKLQVMRQFISYVLGDEPDLPAIYAQSGFGPGANVGIHGNATNAARKILASRWSVSPSALAYASAAMVSHAQLLEFVSEKNAQGIYCHDVPFGYDSIKDKSSYVNHNKITFVPKTVLVHRTIAIEPCLNGYIQKGIDEEMRKRLLRIGINLRDQSVNQEFAREGSLSDCADSFVTIDLSSASDSIATEVVRNLLPYEWFNLLNSTRSKNGMIGGELITYEKFCSMGNGFCFPLETLIFTAAAKAAGCGRPGIDFVVYGDDIIVRKRFAAELISLLRVLGFSVNSEKTFLEGPFRESCGADWFGGKDVRPFTLDFALDSVEAVIKFLNLTKRNDLTSSFFEDFGFDTFKVPHAYRYVRPVPGNDNTAVTVSLVEFMSSPYAVWDRSLQCWSWREFSYSAVRDSGIRKEKGYNLALVYGALSGTSSQCPFSVRRKSHTKIRRMAYSTVGVNLQSPMGTH